MKLLKANKIDQASNELKQLEIEQADLKSEIKFDDRKLFHVIRVEIIDQPGQTKNKVVLTVSKHHPNGFEKLKKSFRYLGYNRIIVLHDPTLLKEEETPMLTEHERIGIRSKAESDVKADMEKEIQKRVDAEVEKRLAKNEAPTGDGDQGSNDDAEKELNESYQDVMENGLKADILAFADDYKIDLGDAKDNDERKAVIKTWFEQKNL